MEPLFTVPVDLEDGYDVVCGYDWLEQLGLSLVEIGLGEKAVMVFTNELVGGHYFDALKASLESAGFTEVVRHNVKDGEQYKNTDEYLRCLTALLDNFPDPAVSVLIVNLGGGVVGDMGGFAAGTFRRGVDYIQVPTSLLGFVDCSVGGKVGVNLEASRKEGANKWMVKNIVGLFRQPRLVFEDLSLLKTLPKRELRSGTAEVIKYAAVCDSTLFEFLEANLNKLYGLDRATLEYVVKTCLEIKGEVVKQDEFDTKSLRIVLNFGHTIGHAIETVAEFELTHGEAISIGMIGAARLGCRLGACAPDYEKRLISLIQKAGLPTDAKGFNLDAADIMGVMRCDKKTMNGKLRFVLPTGLGTWEARVIDDQGPVQEVVQTLI